MRLTRPSVWLGRRVSGQEEGSADEARSSREARSSLLVPLSSKLASSTLNNALYRVGDLHDTSSLIEHLVCASLLRQDL